MSVSRLWWEPQAQLQVNQNPHHHQSDRHILFCFHILYYSLLCTLQVLCGHKEGELPRAAACQEGFRQCQADLPTARSHHLPAAHHGAGQPSALWPQLLHQRNVHQRLTEAGKRGSASRCWHLAEHGAWSGLSLAAVYFLNIVLLLSLLVFMMCVLQGSCWRTSPCAKSCLSPLGLRTMWYAWGCMTPTNICFASPSASFCGRRGHWRSWFLPPTGSSTKLVMFSFSLTKNYSFFYKKNLNAVITLLKPCSSFRSAINFPSGQWQSRCSRPVWGARVGPKPQSITILLHWQGAACYVSVWQKPDHSVPLSCPDYLLLDYIFYPTNILLLFLFIHPRIQFFPHLSWSQVYYEDRKRDPPRRSSRLVSGLLPGWR